MVVRSVILHFLLLSACRGVRVRTQNPTAVRLTRRIMELIAEGWK